MAEKIWTGIEQDNFFWQITVFPKGKKDPQSDCETYEIWHWFQVKNELKRTAEDALDVEEFSRR